MSEFSIVEYYGDNGANKCGYCKQENSSYAHGLWGHALSAQSYQNFIDRGWRRSGKYCYKPTMNKSCCPLYTIRCPVNDFKPSKSQKKVLKRMHKFLAYGNSKLKEETDLNESVEMEDVSEKYQEIPENILTKANQNLDDKTFTTKKQEESHVNTFEEEEHKKSSPSTAVNTHQIVIDGATEEIKGPDPNKPPCKKAKFLRKERKMQKLLLKNQKDGTSDSPSVNIILESKKNIQVAKSIEDFLEEPMPDNPAHTLEIKLMRNKPKSLEFINTLDNSHKVFKSYQMKVHKEKEEECDRDSMKNFLISSPLEEMHHSQLPMGYGSFHQHYILDGHIIAVGVIDLLPNGLSSVYLYYDPKYSFLSLGTYAALREIAFTRKLQKTSSIFRNYYMGYYVHSCPKMRYKGQYAPSELLCPETYTWNPIEKCIPKLEKNKYSRLTEDPELEDPDKFFDKSKTLILHKRELFCLSVYMSIVKKIKEEEKKEIDEYCKLVGKRNCYSILLYRE